MASRIEMGTVPVLALNDTYDFTERDKVVRFQVEWTSKSFGIICDLDLNIYCYDERARFIEKLDVNCKRTKDNSCVLISDTDGATASSNTFSENVKVDFRLFDRETSAVMLFLDGGPRNFQFVQSITVLCEPVAARSVVLPGQAAPLGLFQFTEKSRKDFQGVALAVVYKNGWQPIPKVVEEEKPDLPTALQAQEPKKDLKATKDKTPAKGEKTHADVKMVPGKAAAQASNEAKTAPVSVEPVEARPYEPQVQFVCKPIFEPVFVSSTKAKDEKVISLVVSHVPALEKFRPRLFSNVNEVCAALSSEALPGLKERFSAIHSGLPIGQFTEVIFRQLFKTHPKITDPTERAYTVAMIQEMFMQIDYNGDGSADWDEFTTFCIQTASEVKSGGVSGSNIDEYVIEYQEDSMMRDKVLSPYRPVALMKFVNETKRYLVIPDEADKIIMMDEKFRQRSTMSLQDIIVKNAMGITVSSKDVDGESSSRAGERKTRVYDCVFLTGKDLYAFTCSDHSITVCREQGGIGNRPGAHVLYSRMYHDQLHIKLCWSAANKILCSVANDRIVYGWDIDKPMPIFQVSRHSDIITDFIACDNLDTFITCSMDKRIVMWSAHTRRVKGIFVGHKRGVRCISSFDTTMLSAGFETDARTWDLYTKENVAILKGHRFPIADAKLMCELAQNEKEYRAITVDESGELRLWNIYVKEKASDAITLPALQVFHMNNAHTPLSNIRFIAIPNSSILSTSYYSDIVAVGTKMMHFVPEKNTKEFVPPSCSIFNESSAEVCTLVGKNMFKYDVCKGIFTCVHNDVHLSDLTCITLDSPRGRRCFIGCGNGDLLLVNYMSGDIISMVPAHKKDVNCVVSIQGTRNSVYTGSADGSIVITEELKGDLHIHSTIENAFGEGVGVIDVKVAQSVNVLAAVSNRTQWGLWHASTCKRIAYFNENNHGGPVSRIEILGSSRDDADLRYLDANLTKIKKSDVQKREKEKLLTIAVCTPMGVHIYTLDVTDMRGVQSSTLVYDKQFYVTEITMLRYPTGDSVNYASARAAATKTAAVTVTTTNTSNTSSSASETKSGDKVAAYKSANYEALLVNGALAFIAATDEGHVLVWNVDEARTKSEAAFRARYPHPAKAKRKKISRDIETPATPGTASEMNPSEKEFMSRPQTADDPDEVFSEMQNETQSDLAEPSQASVATLGAQSEHESHLFFATDEYDRTLHDMFDGPGMPPAYLYRDHANHPSINVKVRCCLQFPAHLDSACVLVPMHEHGCFMTASHDGYHRVWNLDKTCLGEMPLPNLTEKMKVPKEPIVGTLGTTLETDMKYWSRPKATSASQPAAVAAVTAAAAAVPLFLNKWKFIQERIAITKVHHDLAGRLVEMCSTNNAGRKHKERRSVSKTHVNVDHIKDVGKFLEGLPGLGENEEAAVQEEVPDEARNLRNYALMAMNEKIGPRDDGPPISIPTKDEIKLLEMKDKLSNAVIRRNKKELYGFDEATGRLGSPGSPMIDPMNDLIDKFNNALTSDENSVHSGEFHTAANDDNNELPPIASSNETRTVRNFGGKNALWRVAGEESSKKDKVRVAKAFSEESLEQSMAAGVIDEESFTLLKTFSASRNNVHQYMNSTKGTVLLRNATHSTTIELPALDDMRRAEISFGVQKDYYKNAELVLNERDNLKKDKMRNAITLGRIEHNVKKVGSMIHLLDPLLVDDVKIPLESKSKEYREKMLAEDKKMQVRLLASAARLPDSASADPSSNFTKYEVLNKFSSARLTKFAIDEAAKMAAPSPSGFDLFAREDDKSKVPKIDKKYEKNIEFLRQLGNVRRPLDKHNVSVVLDKVEAAIDSQWHEEHDLHYAYNNAHVAASKHNLPQAAKEALERKVRTALKDEFNDRIRIQSIIEKNKEKLALQKELDEEKEKQLYGNKPGSPESPSRPGTQPTKQESPNKIVLETRALLPYYKAEDVRHFMDIFTKVDKDFSGDLDMDEWVKLFSSINNTVPESEARSIFMKFKNDKGFLTVNELIPVVFSKATKEQMKLITKFCLAEIMRPSNESVVLTFAEVDQLFEIYDVENLGFVAVGYIKEKVRDMGLNDNIVASFLSNIKDIDEDEMVNHREFGRMYKHLVGKAEIAAQRDEEMRQDKNASMKKK